jgi:hypothetical protein
MWRCGGGRKKFLGKTHTGGADTRGTSKYWCAHIPRVNLNAVWTFVTAAGTNAATRKLPYEMIIVAVK